ncbi:hypothetical protein [Rufibacter ruber]|uniref:hypothetical protein n=1 Tax=Rufibacter ruber TaxID=1783499 RepID=UPI00082A977A|nr:hypothetical protein [Rufibacter ruber]
MEQQYQLSPFTRISLYPDAKALQVECEGFVSSATYRNLMLRGLELIKAYDINYVVYNKKILAPLTPDDHDWLAEEMLPQLFTTSLQKVAIIEAQGGLDHLTLRNMVYAPYLSLSFEVQYFDEVSVALEWFKQEEASTINVTTEMPVEKSSG